MNVLLIVWSSKSSYTIKARWAENKRSLQRKTESSWWSFVFRKLLNWAEPLDVSRWNTIDEERPARECRVTLDSAARKCRVVHVNCPGSLESNSERKRQKNREGRRGCARERRWEIRLQIGQIVSHDDCLSRPPPTAWRANVESFSTSSRHLHYSLDTLSRCWRVRELLYEKW